MATVHGTRRDLAGGEGRVRLGRGLAALVCALLIGHPSLAHADDWLVLPSTVAHEGGGTQSSRLAAQQLARVLASSNTRVLAPERARQSFEQRGSTAPLMIGHGDLDALARDAQMALYHVASGLPAKARQDVERALARADKVLESLNRESLAAQQLLDACLYLVRAHLQDNQREAAREQALECRRLVPDIEPDGTMHPPEVLGVLAEAEAELRQREPGSLRVESEPEGCGVFLNGRHLGTAPLELPQLSPGEYRVQAECEQGTAGRVHRVTVANSRVVMRIDTRFDAAVQTSLELGLQYGDAAAQHERAYADAVEVARVLGTSHVLLVLPVPDAKGAPTDIAQADLIRARDGALLAAVRLRIDAAGAIDGAALQGAAADLREGRQLDRTVAMAVAIADVSVPARVQAPRAHEPETEPAAVAATAAVAPAASPSDAAANATAIDAEASAYDDRTEGAPPTTVGLVLGITGGAAILTGLGFFGYQLSLEGQYSDQKERGQIAEWQTTLWDLDHLAPVPPLVIGGGALVLTASLPWLLPDSPERLPIGSIVSGALGGALAIGGTALLIMGGNCDEFDVEGRCTDILSTTRAGALLLELALPALAVPVVYFLRGGSPSGGDQTVALRPVPTPGGAQLELQGVF